MNATKCCFRGKKSTFIFHVLNYDLDLNLPMFYDLQEFCNEINAGFFSSTLYCISIFDIHILCFYLWLMLRPVILLYCWICPHFFLFTFRKYTLNTLITPVEIIKSNCMNALLSFHHSILVAFNISFMGYLWN